MYGKDHIVDLPVHELNDELMLKILANENVETEEDRTAYQIDTVIAVRDYLEIHPEISLKFAFPPDGKPNDPRALNSFKAGGSEHISAFLGDKNWSKSKIAHLLQLNSNLAPEIVEQLTWSGQSDKSQGYGLSKIIQNPCLAFVFCCCKFYHA